MINQPLVDLTGQVALVTGGGQGIGLRCVQYLVAYGAAVAVNDVVSDRAQAVVRELETIGGVAVAVPADVTDFEEVLSMVARVEDRLGAVTVLVNNAGNAGAAAQPVPQHFWEASPADWRRYLSVNLDAVMYCCRAVIPKMIEAGGGRLLTVTSDAGRVGEAHFEAYSAAKAGAAGLMRSLARSLGRYDITANAVSAGLTASPMTAAIVADQERRSRFLAGYAIRRVGDPSDIAALVAFLASDAAGWITGQTYPVNGGFSAAL